jgi:L,D-transpeptidase catalytic domain/Putative peptidoglycan binding domain
VRRLLVIAQLVASTTASAAAADKPQTVSLRLSPASVVFGSRTLARGLLAPAAAGMRIVIERRAVSGWQRLASARTDSAGRYHVPLRAGRSGTWRARVGDVVSPPVRVEVLPELHVDIRSATAFVGARIVVRAWPAANQDVRVSVLRAKTEVGEVTGHVGRPIAVPAPTLGTLWLRVEVGGRAVGVPMHVSGRTLSVGAMGPDVLGLRARLVQLHVHVPGPSTTFHSELADSVVAFQKARGLERTGVVDARTWQALAQDAVPAPRHRSKGVHIEVSKSRQILMVVRDGETQWYFPVSSGAGGITPVGSYRIIWKALSTTTWLGPAILYRTMTFHTHYAIHGFPSVPTYPASHGCVRIPIWIADWLYQQSPVGERVYVYE